MVKRGRGLSVPISTDRYPIRKTNLLSSDQLIDGSLLSFDDNDGTFGHLLLLLFGQDTVSLGQLLLVFTGLVSVDQVLKRGLVQMLTEKHQNNRAVRITKSQVRNA
jgi:hypothetical protein